jgi:iron complex outermembrane receptor protein
MKTTLADRVGPVGLSFFSLLGALFAGAAAANQPPSELETLEVIGSRAQSRTLADTAVPVDVFSGAELRASGAVGNELGEALAIVAPSFNFPRQSNSVTSDHIRAAQLRGMNPDQLLVLVNGQRRHVSAVVNDNTKIGRGSNAFDFNTIPLSAVERVEILRDGASALYGSDAIAGVINIVLADGADGLVAGVTYGAHHSQVDPIRQTVTDGNTASAWLNLGHAAGRGGSVRYGIEATRRGPTNRTGFDQVSPFIPQTEANLAFQGKRTHRVGDPDTEALGLWLNAEVPLERVTLYGFGAVSLRDTSGAGVFRHPETNQNVPALFPDGFLPKTLGENSDVSITAGVHHLASEWELDHALTVGHNRFEFGFRNSLNPSLGPDSPTRFDSGTFEFSQIHLANQANRRFDGALLGQPLFVAAGLDYRYERFDSQAGDPASFAAGSFEFDRELAALLGFPDIGAQAAKGLTPEDATPENRHVFSLFTEASAKLGERLEVSLAGRYEHYSDFGNTLTGKLAARYRLQPGLAVRASLSNSFRAPSLSQIGWGRRDNTFSSEGGRVSSRLIRSQSALAGQLGLPSLEEETSVNASAGLAWTSRFGLTLSADLFDIRVDDRITQSEFISDAAIIDFVQQLPGGEGVQSIAFFSNAVDTRTRGIEVVLDYRRELGPGQWRVNSAWTRARTDIRSLAPAPGRLSELSPGVVAVDAAGRNTIETATPEHSWITTSTWQGRRWGLLARTRYFSSVVREFSFARQRFGDQWALDAEVSYALTSAWSVTAGASNLLDHYPDESANANNFFGNFAFDPINPIGLNGRFVYLRGEARF